MQKAFWSMCHLSVSVRMTRKYSGRKRGRRALRKKTSNGSVAQQRRGNVCHLRGFCTRYLEWWYGYGRALRALWRLYSMSRRSRWRSAAKEPGCDLLKERTLWNSVDEGGRRAALDPSASPWVGE